jgi:hypothetical protein
VTSRRGSGPATDFGVRHSKGHPLSCPSLPSIKQPGREPDYVVGVNLCLHLPIHLHDVMFKYESHLTFRSLNVRVSAFVRTFPALS